jgi:hypothetical protein
MIIDYSHIEGADMLWGTYGYHGTNPLTWKPFLELCSDHIQAILETQQHIYTNLTVLNAFREILKARGVPVPLAFDPVKYANWVERLRKTA